MKLNKMTEDFGYIIEKTAESEQLSEVLAEKVFLLSEADGGAILLRGFEVDLNSFKALTSEFSEHFRVATTNLEDRYYPDRDPTFASVNSGGYAIDFHNELTLPYTPDVFWMYCLTPAEKFGKTAIVDGKKVLSSLTPKTKEALIARDGYWYFEQSPPYLWQRVTGKNSIEDAAEFMRGMSEVSQIEIVDDQLSFRFRTQPVSYSKLSGAQVFCCGLLDFPDQVIDKQRKPYERAIVTEIAQATHQHAVWLDWQEKDILVVDNTRVMHARQAFEDPFREIVVRYADLKPNLVKPNQNIVFI
jgi:hypothetical protein